MKYEMRYQITAKDPEEASHIFEVISILIATSLDKEHYLNRDLKIILRNHNPCRSDFYEVE